MESALEAFAKTEERLRQLALRPSEYVRRQIRVTPYPTEPVGWIIEQAGEEVCLFSSDYPHVEGGRNPIKRFEASMGDCSEAAQAALLLRQLRRPDGHRAGGVVLLGASLASSVGAPRGTIGATAPQKRCPSNAASMSVNARCSKSLLLRAAAICMRLNSQSF